MSKRILFPLICLAVIALLMSACQPAPAGADAGQAAVPVDTAPASPAVTLYYVGRSSQVELTSPQGVRVLIDVASPSLLSSPATERDVLLTSHHHPDHYYVSFVGSFPGKQLNVQAGEIVAGDVTVRSMVARHALTNFGAASECDNAIFVIEMGGLRIAHLGDFGQLPLTEEQASFLGKPDVVIGLLGNARIFRQVLAERTMFGLIAQMEPALVIPTDHSDTESVGYAAEQWQGFYSADTRVTLTSADLSDQTQFLMLGTLATSYGILFELTPWTNLAAGR
jgi:L-ascorbate metabolism protein UlaG (beta-lactamase superfamily)